MKKLQILILSCIALINTTFGQKHCKCNLNQIVRRNNDKNPDGQHLSILQSGTLQHPITTFYRYGKVNWFDATKTQAENLTNLRSMFSGYLDNEKTTVTKDRRYLNRLYKAIYNEAFGTIGEYNIKNDSESDNAKIAKAAAYVLLIDINGRGQALTGDTITILKNQAVSVIKRLEWDNGEERPDDYVYRASSGNYSSKHYWLTKTLIMLLQSYDYLKAVYPNDQDVIECGYLLHCYSREIYNHAGNARWSALRRNDNHALMSAGALGLASVVLADHSAKNVYNSWQPQNWADVAHSRINAVLFDSTGHTRESARGGVFGFGEGTHYFRMAFENLLPFMLAYKNGNPTEQLNITVEGIRIEDGSYWNQEKYVMDIEKNYMDDSGIANLVEWMYSLTFANGDYASIDDSYIGQSFGGLCIFRDFKGVHHDSSQIFINVKNTFVDQRADVAAVLSEGYLYDVNLIQPNNGYFLDGGNIIHEGKVKLNFKFGNEYRQLSKQLFFHINAESGAQATDYISIGGHEHNDALSFQIACNGKYLAYPSGIRKDEDFDLRRARYHNTVVNTTNLIWEGASDGGTIIQESKFERNSFEVDLKNQFLLGKSIYRKVKSYPSIGGTMYKITDSVFTNQTVLSSYSSILNGNGRLDDKTLSIDTLGDNFYKLIWRGNCNSDDEGAQMINYIAINENNALLFPSIEVHPFTINDGGIKISRFEFKIPASNYFVMHNFTHISSCKQIVDTIINPVPIDNGGGFSNYDNGIYEYFFVSFGDSIYLEGLLGDRNDTISTDAESIHWFHDINDYSGQICTRQFGLRDLNLNNLTQFHLNDKSLISSSSRVMDFNLSYHKLYEYTGSLTGDFDFDTLTFYLPEVPPTYLSLMEEKSGLDFSYDTTTQKMTLYLADSGEYHFRFEPSNPCAVSCFYPPIEILGHFEHERSHERLGHILTVKTQDGWLDMKEGARMNICTKAVLYNADSLSLSSEHGCPKTKSSGTDGLGNTKGFAAHYLNSEGNRYRSSYRVGSGAGLDQDGVSGNDMDKVKGPSKRTMIIVENEGALVLKSGSHTVVGNGSTILVKPGGTLKIENGATVVIGSHDSIGCGFGEIIVMDSAFLCVGSQANVSFYDNSPDTVDKHIMFVSMNPDHGALNGIAPTSNAVDTAAECVAFCDFRATFPEYGVGNYRHGWSNLGKPFAWMEEIGVICYGNDVYANGLYSLNETRYRFEVCKYNKVTQQCMEAVDTIPMNDTDNYFGGRLQGRVNLSHLYQTYCPGKDFESGNDYRIRFIIHNDCGLTDEVVEIVEMPDPLTAVVTGDTVTCGGQGAITVNGSASTGEIDSLRWEVWAYKPFPELDSATYFANADTFVALIDTFWLDSVTIDTVVADTFWFYKSDTVDNDSFHYAKYYQQYWDTMIASAGVGTFNFGRVFFHSGRKYRVLLTLFNPCGISTDSLIVRIKDGPTVSAGTDRYIPYGSPAVPHPVLHGSVGPTANSFSWSPSTGLSATNILAPTATPSSTVSYVLSASDADGCTNYDTVLVYVNTVANAGRDTTICFDDSVQVGTAAVSGYDYLWSPAGLVSNPGIAQPYAFAPNEVNTLLLSVYQNGNLVGLDDMVLYRDSLDSITFAINPGGSPFSASFTVFHTPIDYTDIVWDFDDGTGTYSGNSVDFTYAFPNVPNGIYNVCAAFANACGTQNSCKDCEFDMLGTVMPKPPVPNSAAPINQPEHIWVWPNPFAHYTMLEYAIGQNDGAYVEITDLTGRVIRTLQVRGSAGQIKIDLGPRAVGVYHYRFVNANTEIARGKLVMIR